MAIIIVNGRLGAKPENKTSKNGSSYVTFSVAESEKNGQKEETIWYKCMWMNPANTGILSFLDKGSAISISGRLRKPKVFQRRDGSADVDITVFVTDVSFLPTNRQNEQASYKSSASIHDTPATAAPGTIDENECPF